MTKKFIFNILLYIGFIFLLAMGTTAYRSGNVLVAGLAIALSVVLIYLKVVLLRQVNRELRDQRTAPTAPAKVPRPVKTKKKRR